MRRELVGSVASAASSALSPPRVSECVVVAMCAASVCECCWCRSDVVCRLCCCCSAAALLLLRGRPPAAASLLALLVAAAHSSALLALFRHPSKLTMSRRGQQPAVYTHAALIRGARARGVRGRERVAAATLIFLLCLPCFCIRSQHSHSPSLRHSDWRRWLQRSPRAPCTPRVSRAAFVCRSRSLCRCICRPPLLAAPPPRPPAAPTSRSAAARHEGRERRR